MADRAALIEHVVVLIAVDTATKLVVDHATREDLQTGCRASYLDPAGTVAMEPVEPTTLAAEVLLEAEQ